MKGDNMTHEQALEKCKAEVSRLGFTVSSGSWSDSDMACAFSVEDCGPATYGHPRATVSARNYQDGNGWRFAYKGNYISLANNQTQWTPSGDVAGPNRAPEAVRCSDFGCPNCLWYGVECKNGEKYAPRLSAVDRKPSCAAYAYCD
jgi:hypothetical protein